MKYGKMRVNKFSNLEEMIELNGLDKELNQTRMRGKIDIPTDKRYLQQKEQVIKAKIRHYNMVI